jgi:hypothetical protein
LEAVVGRESLQGLPSASPEAYLSDVEKDRNEAHARAARGAGQELKRTLGATRQKAFALGVSTHSIFDKRDATDL